jgi:hypothetical protein
MNLATLTAAMWRSELGGKVSVATDQALRPEVNRHLVRNAILNNNDGARPRRLIGSGDKPGVRSTPNRDPGQERGKDA